MRSDEQSARVRVKTWVRQHKRAVGIGVTISALALFGFAAALGWAILTGPRLAGEADASPTVRPTLSSKPTDAPSTSPSPTADDLLLQVSIDGLRMRATASTSAGIVRSLDRGEVVRVMSGPVEADSYAWYEVVDLDSQSGWVAMGDGADAWLETVPVAATASDLQLRYQRDCDVSPRTMGGIPVWPPDLTLTADGQVVLWSGGGRLGTGGGLLVVRQLSPSGLDNFQREVLDLGVLQQSADYGLERLPNTPDPPGHGVCVNSFTLGEGTGRVNVTAVAWLDEEEGVYWVPSPERKAIDELSIHLEEAEAWLGAAAWSEPVARGYASSSYLFWLEPPSDTPVEGVNAPSVTGAAWPFDGPIEQFGEPVAQARCGYLDLGQAFEVLRLMREREVPTQTAATASPRQLSLDGFGNGTFATEGSWHSFWLTPRSPDGYPSCAD